MSFWLETRSLSPLVLPPVAAARLQVSFLVPARECGAVLDRTIARVTECLQRLLPGRFEIVIVPNGERIAADGTYEVAEALARANPAVRVVPHVAPHGKGAVLRTGFAASRGEWLFFTDADLPYDLGFFNTAVPLLESGVDFVTGNRRLAESRFDVPVPVLRMAYRRHRFGLHFNRVVRCLFPITTTDTQAGIKAMSRRMAAAAFATQRCPGFFFDVEFFLCCAAHGFRHAEIPVTLFLNSEESTVKLFRQSLLAGVWLAKIFAYERRGWYAGSSPAGPEGSA